MIDNISSQYAHAAIKCCDEGCRLNMSRSPRAVILKGELLDSTHTKKMCDCIIFRSDTKIVLVELKHKNLDPRSIHEKLHNGACMAMKIWSGITNKKPTLFFAVVAESFKDHTAYLRLSHDRIVIKSKKYSIRTAECGSDIAEIVKKYK